MPRLVPVEWERLERVFTVVGFVFVRQEGSHGLYFREGTARPVVIPVYDQVPVYVIKNT